MRIKIKNPNHPETERWDIELAKWREYKFNLDLYLRTEEEANAETSRVLSALEELRILEVVNDLEIHSDGLTTRNFLIS